MNGIVCPARRRVGVVALTFALTLLTAGTLSPAPVDAKPKKIRACVTKDGTMAFSRSGKCGKGERKLSWNKKGKRGKAGAAGAVGPTGPAGPSGTAADLEALEALVAQQGLLISGLTTDLDDLASEVAGLSTDVDGILSDIAGLQSDLGALDARVDAACDQLTAVTTQSDDVVAAMGVISALLDPLTLGTLPDLPAALGAFSCP
jgi:hypothetical protein